MASESSAPPASPIATAAAPPAEQQQQQLSSSSPTLPSDVIPSSIPPAAAAEDVIHADAGPLAPPAARVERTVLRRIMMPLAFPFHRVRSGMTLAGDLLGGAYRRSFVAGYIADLSAICVRTGATLVGVYRRSILAIYVSTFSTLCVRSWRAAGVVFNPLPPGSNLLPVSDPSLVIERLSFAPDMDRLHLVGLVVFVVGAILFVFLEVMVVSGVIDRYDQYYAILKLVCSVLQRLLVGYSKVSDFYNNVEWLRMEMARERQQLPPPAGKQQLNPPVGEQQLPAPIGQQQLPTTVEQQQLPSPVAEQQQQPPPPPAEQQQLPPPLPPELDLC